LGIGFERVFAGLDLRFSKKCMTFSLRVGIIILTFIETFSQSFIVSAIKSIILTNSELIAGSDIA